MVFVDVGYSNTEAELEASSLCEVAARRQSAHTHYSPCLQSQLPVTCNGELCPVHRLCGRSAQLRSPPTSGIGLRGFTTRIMITTGPVRRGRGGGGGYVSSRLKGWGGGYVSSRLKGWGGGYVNSRLNGWGVGICQFHVEGLGWGHMSVPG